MIRKIRRLLAPDYDSVQRVGDPTDFWKAAGQARAEAFIASLIAQYPDGEVARKLTRVTPPVRTSEQ